MSCRPLLFIVLFCFAFSAGAADVLIRHFEPASLEPRADKQMRRAVELRLPGRLVTLELSPNESLLQHAPAALRKSLSSRGFELFAGHVAGVDGSWVRLSHDRGVWQGAWFDGESLYMLDPAAAVKDLGAAPRDASYVVYRMEDVLIEGFEHDEAAAPGAYHDLLESLRESLPAAKSGMRELTMTVVTDSEFTTLHGSNRNSVVAGRLNVVDGIYREQLRVRVTLGHLRHLDNNGTLTTTDGSALLSAFRTFMNSAAASIPKGGVSHLFSGKDFDGSTAGVAYVGTLCSNTSANGVNQVRSTSTVTALIIAHEMGHNFGARHDGQTGSPCESQEGRWLMSPSIGSSQTRFSQCSLDSILPRIANASCLAEVTTTSGFYADGFEG